MSVDLSPQATCFCGRNRAYERCCGPLHLAGHAGLGTSAEDTMRARYCAYVLEDEAFLLATWHSTTRPDAVRFTGDVVWEGLTVEDAHGGGALDVSGTVSFTARFRRNGTPLALQERSTFERIDGRWFYVEGSDPDT